ncbi:MAG: UDP-N-acetylmuramate dehydrogenase [Pseudomonadota bacterium]
MTGTSLIEDLKSAVPNLRGRLTADAPLKDITWFRVGGAADVLFVPADEADLSEFLRAVDSNLPVHVIGLGSNLLARDGGVRGVVIRLGRGLAGIQVEPNQRLRVGTAVPDVKVARAAGEAGIDGLAFYRGIPGSIGGALRMNAGAHGSETRDVLETARAVDRAGNIHELTNADMGFAYRKCAVPPDWIFTEAVFRGRAGESSTILQQMEDVAAYRETHQPIRERTGGSTFKNPEGHSAWKLIDAAGCRGLRVGGAHVSEKHCNFLINDAQATARDIEQLGETVRKRVFETSGIRLAWEIFRLGEPENGDAVGEALALESTATVGPAAQTSTS